MPRQLRREYAVAIYQVMSRGPDTSNAFPLWPSVYNNTLRQVMAASGKCQFSLFKLLTAVAEFWQVGGDAASTAP